MTLVIRNRLRRRLWKWVALAALLLGAETVWAQIAWVGAPNAYLDQKTEPTLPASNQIPSQPDEAASEPLTLKPSPTVWANDSGDLPPDNPSLQTAVKQSAVSPEANRGHNAAGHVARQTGADQPTGFPEAQPPAPKPAPPSQPELLPSVPEAPQPPETTQSLQKLFDAFLEKPTQENYFQVLDALCRHPAYNPYSAELEEVAHLLENRRYEEAKAKLDQAMPNLLLSPRAHNYYRVIAEAAGDAQEAQRRDQIAQKCLQGILTSGQGMVDPAAGEPKQGQAPMAPFHVARVSDEYDLVRALGKRARVHSQSLRSINGRWYDVLRCSDETGQVFYIWFDVTRPMSALSRQIRQSPPQPHDKENPP